MWIKDAVVSQVCIRIISATHSTYPKPLSDVTVIIFCGIIYWVYMGLLPVVCCCKMKAIFFGGRPSPLGQPELRTPTTREEWNGSPFSRGLGAMTQLKVFRHDAKACGKYPQLYNVLNFWKNMEKMIYGLLK